jgi:hypothetical protein
MKEKFKQLIPIQNILIFVLLVLLSILTTQTSAIAQPLTRAQVAIFLLRSKRGKNYTPPQATGIFDDVPVTHWAADWIEQLYREKITHGCSASPLRYCPDSFVTGVQTALFTARTLGGPPAAVPKTGGVSWAPGDDGGLQKGVQWPDPRFADNGDGTVTDHLTGLIWLKNADCFGDLNWNDALEASNNLADGDCGLSDGSVPGDWRLPNVRELHSLYDFGTYGQWQPPGPFTGVQKGKYWSSTAHPEVGLHWAWYVSFFQEIMDVGTNDQGESVWPVRGDN